MKVLFLKGKPRNTMLLRNTVLLTASFFWLWSALAGFAQTQVIRVSTEAEPIAKGNFEPTWQSLAQYQVPDWFRNAKFGIWAHWGPQCQPEMGDWYARGMYEQGGWQYKSHLTRYGHPSRFGFKDVINEWKAEKWNPEQLVALYKRTGAQYFFAMANHHDNLDLWNSKYQEWNSTRVGPKKNIVDQWAKAARKYQLPFGLSVHASHAWMWYETAQKADTTGPYKGVSYDGKLTKADGKGSWWDGLDPQQLYAQDHTLSTGYGWEWNNGCSIPSQEYCQKFFNRTMDLINQYNPDLLYFDDSVLPLHPVSDAGLKLAAHYYNHNMATHKGKLQGVMFGKVLDDEQKKCMVWDVERGAPDKLQPLPWQTCTCIGDWHYNRGRFADNSYKSAREVVLMLIDIVSKNGNLLLNIPVRGDGSIDQREVETLTGIAAWMDINKESIFNTRPWKTFGEGPTAQSTNPIDHAGFNEGKTRFSDKDIRFAQNKNLLYATIMGKPTEPVKIKALGSTKIKAIKMLGSNEVIKWSQADGVLTIEKPNEIPNDIAVVFEIVS
ncbi:alpha-L-fucosidase [Cytophagaceae bacterium YF14B1]|uniref:alpha-L-fucosidase n=2 Tax=Xanthocytophaga flava TaxID=3048013 RepID=A0AAE3UCK4_9BACT|nr:alpha-L-fucosidase [Xanthocytophaga flavus]